jgi:PilZ domain
MLMQAQEVLKNFTVAKISVPVHGDGMVELDCVVHMTTPPHFEATFLPDQLPASRLDLEKNCKVFYFANGQGHLLNSQISKVLSKEKLLLAVKKNKIFHHARDYFRVDAPGRVHFELVSKRETDLREYEGIINISGGGARFPVRDNFSLHQKIRLNFFFRSPLEVEIDCLGEVVRARNFHLNKDLAIKFIQIEPKDREKLISLCMAIQREELRTKVRISDPFASN